MPKRYKQIEVDKLMENIPRLPNKFKDWMFNSPFKDMNYMFYKRNGSKKTGLCSKCKELVDLKNNNKHNDKGRCPECKAKVTYKAINMAKYYRDHQVVSVLQKFGEDYLVRYFKVVRKFKHAHDTSDFPDQILETLINPEISFYEASRVYISLSKYGHTEVRYFETEWDWNQESFRWVNERRRGGMNNRELLRNYYPYIYKRNLKSILKKSRWKYSGLDSFNGHYISIEDYLTTWENYPIIEMLSKLKFNNALKDLVYRGAYNREHISFNKKRLGLSKRLFNLSRNLDLGVQDINTLSYFDKKGLIFNEVQSKEILEYSWALEKILEYSKFEKALNYIKKQSLANNTDKKDIATDWRDYINQCEWLKLDLNSNLVLYPRDLYQKHRELTEIIEKTKKERTIKGVKEKFKMWNDLLSYSNKKLSISVAKTIEELKKEGGNLHHCVGSFGPHIAEGRALVLFIRKKANESFYTLELNPKTFKVIQTQGLNRVKPTKQVENFINEWEAKKLMVLKEMKQEAM